MTYLNQSSNVFSNAFRLIAGQSEKGGEEVFALNFGGVRGHLLTHRVPVEEIYLRLILKNNNALKLCHHIEISCSGVL